MANAMIGGGSVDAGLLKELFRQFDDGTMSNEKLKAIVGGKAAYPTLSGKWIEDILVRNFKCLLDFGLTDFDHLQLFFRSILERIGEKQVKTWQKMLLEPVWWPTISLGPKDNYAGFKHKPVSLYERAEKGKSYRFGENGELVKNEKPYILQGGVYLVDSRCRPYYKDGEPMWNNDKKFLGWRIKKLRQERKLAKYDWCDATSRFGISAIEAESHLWPMMATHPDFQDVLKIRSEGLSEFNFIEQCFSFMPRYFKDEKTNTSVWLVDVFEYFDGSIGHGYSEFYTPPKVRCADFISSFSFWSVRPLVVLALESS